MKTTSKFAKRVFDCIYGRSFIFYAGSAKFTDPFDWDIVGRNVFAMIIMSGIYLLITLFVQYRKVFFKPRYEIFD